MKITKDGEHVLPHPTLRTEWDITPVEIGQTVVACPYCGEWFEEFSKWDQCRCGHTMEMFLQVTVKSERVAGILETKELFAAIDVLSSALSKMTAVQLELRVAHDVFPCLKAYPPHYRDLPEKERILRAVASNTSYSCECGCNAHAMQCLRVDHGTCGCGQPAIMTLPKAKEDGNFCLNCLLDDDFNKGV